MHHAQLLRSPGKGGGTGVSGVKASLNFFVGDIILKFLKQMHGSRGQTAATSTRVDSGLLDGGDQGMDDYGR